MDDLKTGGNASSVLLPGSRQLYKSQVKFPVTKQRQLVHLRALFTDVDVQAGLQGLHVDYLFISVLW